MGCKWCDPRVVLQHNADGVCVAVVLDACRRSLQPNGSKIMLAPSPNAAESLPRFSTRSIYRAASLSVQCIDDTNKQPLADP